MIASRQRSVGLTEERQVADPPSCHLIFFGLYRLVTWNAILLQGFPTGFQKNAIYGPDSKK